jgi:hypothetical protein
MPVLAAMTPREWPWAFKSGGVFDLILGVGDRPSDLATGGFGDGAGMGRAFGGEGAFHLSEQRQQQEGDAAHQHAGGHGLRPRLRSTGFGS